MNMIKKILIFLSGLSAVMLLLPILAVRFAPADFGMALCFILFFAVDPEFMIFTGVMAKSNIKKLWWLPILSALLSPLLFAVAVGEIVTDLFIYSAIYLLIGLISMLPYRRKKTEQE